MCDKLRVEKLVKAEEAVVLLRYRTIADVEIAREIEHAFLKAHKEKTDSLWKKYFLLSTIWNAGRIQGIREERRKRIS